MFSFRLPTAFVARFAEQAPDFGYRDAGGTALGEVTFLRTYSRVKPDGSKERWWEVCERVINGMYSIQKDHALANRLPWSDAQATESAMEAYERMFSFKWLPPGRGLWMMGTDYVHTGHNAAALQNCSMISTGDFPDDDPAWPYAFLMEASMLGVGVGLDTKMTERHIEVRRPDPERTRTYVVPDTREGWVESVRRLLNSYLRTDGITWRFEYHDIRPAGTPIKGFGGTAAGPEPLRVLHTKLTGLLEAKVGQKVDTELTVDIANLIGVCVVAGNVRRCLPAGTRVHTARGSIPIEQVSVGDDVVTAAGRAPVTAVFVQGTQDTIRIRHEFGAFECTPNHQVAVFDSLTTWTFKRADELTGDDHLVWDPSVAPGVLTALPALDRSATVSVDPTHRRANGRSPGYARSTSICSVDGCDDGVTAAGMCNRHYIRNRKYGDPLAVGRRSTGVTIPDLDADVAWLIGLIHGDGYVYVRPDGKVGHISIACDPAYPGVIEQVRKVFSRFGIDHLNEVVPTDNDGSLKLRASSVELAEWVKAHVKQANEPLLVPEWIFAAEPEVRAGYLAGVFDADGSDKTRPLLLAASVYPQFCRDLVALCASLGIAAEVKTTRKDHPNGWQDLFHVNVVGYESGSEVRTWLELFSKKYRPADLYERSARFGFAHDFGVAHGLPASYAANRFTVGATRKLGRTELPAWPVRVHGIEDGRSVATYDIEVEGIHQFTAEGFVVHNSAELVLGDPGDEVFTHLKDPEWFPERNSYDPETPGWGWMSNNSIAAHVGMDYEPYLPNVALNGEPGFVWMDVIHAYGRTGDAPDHRDHRAAGVNPCSFAGETIVMTTQGPRRIDSLAGRPFWALVDGTAHLSPKGAWVTGTDDIHALRTVEGHEVHITGNHRVRLASGEWCEAADLVPGDKVVLHNHREVPAWEGPETFDDGIDAANALGDALVGESHELTSSEFHRGFLRGLFTALGGVDVDGDEPQVEMCRGDACLVAVQRMLGRLGVKSAYDDGLLTVTGDDLAIFAERVGFADGTIASETLAKATTGFRTTPARPFVATVESFEFLRRDDVWDLTVSDVHAFDANGLYVSNSEQPLESGELCTLVECYLNRHDSRADFLRTLKFAFLYAKTVTLVPTHWAQSNAVMQRNRRIGCSVSGMAAFADTHGLPELRSWLDDGYHEVRRWDRIYSEWLCVRESIRVTTVKPSGCRPWYALTTTDAGVLTLEEILMASGHREGEEWADLNGVRALHGSGDTAAVTRTYDNGKAEVLRVSMDYGLTVDSTPNHRWFVTRRRNISSGRFGSAVDAGEWVRTDELRPGDILDVRPGVYDSTTEAELVPMDLRAISMRTPLSEMTQPTHMSPDLAWLLGYLWGDGAMSPAKFRLRFIDGHVMNLHKAQRIFSEIFSIDTELHPASQLRQAHVLEVGNKCLWHWLIRNGVWKYHADRLDLIPEVVRRSSRESILAFAAGLLDSDGSIVRVGDYRVMRWGTADQPFARHLQDVLLAAGVVLGRSLQVKGESFQTKRNYVHLQSAPESLPDAIRLVAAHSNKAAADPEGAQLPWSCEREGHRQVRTLGMVRRVESLGWAETFDVEVEHEHWYYAGGVKSHNTTSLLASSTPGVHWAPGGKLFWRAIRFAADDPIVAILDAAGYRIEDDVVSAGTKVVFFPIRTDQARAESEVTIFEKANMAAEAQRHWSDNAVSVTVSFDAETEAQHVGTVVHMHEGSLKTISFLPQGNATYPQMPYTPMDEATYEEWAAKLEPVDLTPLYEGTTAAKDAVGEAYCTNDRCELPAAPSVPGGTEFEKSGSGA